MIDTNQNDPVLLDGERLDNVNRDLRLIQNTQGLLYGTDSYMLAAFMRHSHRDEACELGAGTGIISLLCASAGKFKHTLAVEVQEYYASLIGRNAVLNDLSDRVEPMCEDIRNLGRTLCGSFGVVFSNPPYMKVGNGKRNLDDKKYIARHEVMGDIGDFVSAASRLLKFGGRAYFVMRPDRLCDLFSYMRRDGIEPKRICFVHANTRSEPSSALVEGVRGGNPSLTVERPLFLYRDGTGDLTEDAERIYETLGFEERF